MLALAVGLWLDALLVTSALLGVVLLVQGTSRRLRRLAHRRYAGPVEARVRVALPSPREPVPAREQLIA